MPTGKLKPYEINERKDFGQKVKYFRQKLGLTQEDVADAIEMSRPYIVNLEAGRSGISLSTIYALAFAFGIEPGRLLKSYVEL